MKHFAKHFVFVRFYKKSHCFKNASGTVFRKIILLRPPCTCIFKTFILINRDIIENRNWMSVSMFWKNTIYILSIICEVYPVRLSQWLILNFGESNTIEIDALTVHQIQNSNPITDSNEQDKVINWTNIFLISDVIIILVFHKVYPGRIETYTLKGFIYKWCSTQT